MKADKILAIVAFVCITSALAIIARTPPATGYELSIYDAYPPYFWFLIVASISCGIVILVHQAFSKEKSNWWLAGLCIILFSNSMFLGLPFFRGYAIYPTGDTPTHLGLMKDIITTGHIGEQNFYPVVHLLGVSILDITGLAPGIVARVLSVSWSAIYLLNMYLLATVVAKYRGQALLITAFASPLVFSWTHISLHPLIFSISMLPLLLYFYHRRKKGEHQVGNAAVLILLAFLITYAHPITCLFAVAVLLTFNLSKCLYRQIANGEKLPLRSSTVMAGNYNIPLIMFMVFFIWYFSYALLQENLKTVYDGLRYHSVATIFQLQTATLVTGELTPSQTIELFIYRYGAIFLYILISVLAVAIVLKKSLNREVQSEPMDFAYGIQFVVALLISGLFLWGYFIEHDPIRISRFFLMMAPIVSGLVAYRIISSVLHQVVSSSRSKVRGKMFIGLVTLLILAASAIAVFNVYGSPRTVVAGRQATRMEISGVEWLAEYQGKDILARGVTIGGRKLEDLLGLEHPYLDRVGMRVEPVQVHFGYDQNDFLAETFNFKDTYLVTSKLDRIFALTLSKYRKSITHPYSADDFTKLQSDRTVAQIYANGEFEVWRVYAQ